MVNLLIFNYQLQSTILSILFNYHNLKMKTLSKFNLCVLAAAAIFAASCKGKPASSVPTSNSTTAVSAKGNSVMDSLNITDPDEKKVCALYDDAITDYLSNSKLLLTDTSKAAEAQRKALDEKWRVKEAEIKPQVQALQQRVAMNPSEAMKFAQFSVYESKRLMALMSIYQKEMMKNMPGSK